MMDLRCNYHKICEHIRSLDGSIRFAGVASMEARILTTQSKEGLAPLLTQEEPELLFMQLLIRMAKRKTLKQKLGKTIYATRVYQKVKRATIPLYDEDS